jgi:hypothetical protein
VNTARKITTVVYQKGVSVVVLSPVKSEVTPKKLEAGIKSLINSFSKGFNEAGTTGEKAETAVKGIVEIIGNTLSAISQVDPEYPFDKKLKKYTNKLYKKLDGYGGVKVKV